jgi:hypothetical protein
VRKSIFIGLFISLAAYLAPEPTLACDMVTPTAASCCRQKNDQQARPLLHPDHISAQKENTNHHCKGECGHSFCQCAFMNIAVELPCIPDIKEASSNFEERNFSFPDTDTSAGFYAVWLPPKIS